MIIISSFLFLSTLPHKLTPKTAHTSPSTASTAEVDANYARLLQHSLYLYDTNMCGNEVD